MLQWIRNKLLERRLRKLRYKIILLIFTLPLIPLIVEMIDNADLQEEKNEHGR